jgi:type IV secretory pathway VirB2 component (pilin)
MNKTISQIVVAILLLLVLSGPAIAGQVGPNANFGGQALPWEGPLTSLQHSLSGPVATSIAIIALAAIGVMLIFGGEWNEFARRAVFAVCAIALMLSGTALVTTLFVQGATV